MESSHVLSEGFSSGTNFRTYRADKSTSSEMFRFHMGFDMGHFSGAERTLEAIPQPSLIFLHVAPKVIQL